MYQRALAINDETYGADHPVVAASLDALASFYKDQGQYGRVEPLYQRSLSIYERVFGSEHPYVATSLSNLAGLYEAQGQYGRVEPLYQRSLSIYDKVFGSEHPYVAISLNNMAGLHKAKGEYARVEPLYRRALAINEKTYGPDHPAVATSLNDLAEFYRALNQFAKAEPLYQRALAIYEKILGQEHPYVATSLNNLANLYRDQKQYAKAEPFYQRSRAIIEKALGPEHPNVATSLNNLAKLYAAQEQYTEAEPLYQRSLAIYEKTLGAEHPYVATSLNNLAAVYQSLREYEKVLPLRNRALRIAGATNIPEIQWRVEDGLRETLGREGKPDLAIYFGKQAVNTIQAMRAGLTSLDREWQQSFLQDKTKAYRGLADLLIDDGRLPEAQQVLAMLKEEEFFDFINRAGNEDNRTTEAGYTAAEQSWQKRYQEISSRLGSVGRELEELDRKAKVKLSEEESARREQLRADRKVAQQAMDRFLGDLMRELDTASTQRNREVGERNLTNLRALQDTLGALGHGAVTLHYVMGETKLRMILTTPTIQIARESAISSKELNHKVQEFHALLSDPKSNPLPLAQELYKLLIGPIVEDLKQSQSQTLMVSLDGAMRYIPLAALHDGNHYVIEDYRIANYTEAAKDKLKDIPQIQWRVAGLGLTRKVEGFYALPSVKQEIEGIVKAGNRGVLPGEAHFDFDFTANQLRDALDKSYPVLHIASHFVFKPGNESNSFLLLGDGKQLTLRDLKDDDFRFRDVDLITLSACETAVGGGNDANGLEIEGFGALAQKQGAKSVIATLWSVADKSTGILMQNLYRIREQTKGITKVESLREAQLGFINGLVKSPPEYSYTHPFFWAPFILMGNWL